MTHQVGTKKPGLEAVEAEKAKEKYEQLPLFDSNSKQVEKLQQK